MTEEELARIETYWGFTDDDYAEVGTYRAVVDCVPALIAEVRRRRAIEEAATALRERVRDWCTIPYRDGEDEAYGAATNVAEDALMSAADAYDAALAGRGGPGEEAP